MEPHHCWSRSGYGAASLLEPELHQTMCKLLNLVHFIIIIIIGKGVLAGAALFSCPGSGATSNSAVPHTLIVKVLYTVNTKCTIYTLHVDLFLGGLTVQYCRMGKIGGETLIFPYFLEQYKRIK
jgi:hypothetical protein